MKTKSFFQSGYPKYYRKHAHELLQFGYQRARVSITADTHEPTITGRIAEQIQIGLNSYHLLPDYILKKGYVVAPESSEIRARDPLNIKDSFQRLDIVIINSRKIPQVRYIFEGKRLKESDFSISKYSLEGVMRFVSCTYGADCSEAAMVGFYQNLDAPTWHGKLKDLYNNDTENSMATIDTLAPCSVIPSIPDEYFSSHDRVTKGPIGVFHILLNCC